MNLGISGAFIQFTVIWHFSKVEFRSLLGLRHYSPIVAFLKLVDVPLNVPRTLHTFLDNTIYLKLSFSYHSLSRRTL